MTQKIILARVIGIGVALLAGSGFVLAQTGGVAVDGEEVLLLDDAGAEGEDGFMLLDEGPDDAAGEDLSIAVDEELSIEEGTLMLDDEGMVGEPGDAGDNLVLDDAAEADDLSGDAVMVLDDDSLELEPGGVDEVLVEQDEVMVLDDAGPEAADTVAEVDLESGDRVLDESGDMMLEQDVETAASSADLTDDLDADLADALGEPIEEGAGEPLGEEVMVLEDEGVALGGADDAALDDLDADIAGFQEEPDGAGEAAAAGAGVMMLDDAGAEPLAGADAGLDEFDADVAGMLGGAEAGEEGGQGDLVLDADGALSIEDGDAVIDPADGAVLALDDGDEEVDDETSALSVYAVLKNETAVFVKSGTVTGREKSTLGGGDHNAGKVFKSEFSLNVFANAQITEDALVHLQLNLAYDPQAEPDWYRGPQFYSQYDPIKELYLDTSLPLFDDEGVYMRLGKQQVVWGTADGIKLLDIINPTDFREFVQNTFEDSRIPVTMLNLERNIGANGNIQFIVAENRKNRIPGLDKDGDSGQPFIMKGVDTITGAVNGFLNISPALGKVADAFNRLSALSGSPIGLTPLSFVTVDDFATNNPVAQSIFGSACSASFDPSTPTSAACLKDITERPDETLAPGVVLPGGDNQFVTNLIDAETQSEWDTNNPNSAFEYMSKATFATFNTFVSAKSRYEQDEPDNLDPNLGGRWKSTLGSNFNYSLNYFYAYDANPSVSISWRNDAGEQLKVKKVKAQDYVDAGILPAVPAGTAGLETILVKDSAGRTYGAFDGDPTSPGFGGPGAGAPTLVFTEKRHRVHNLGASFDYALDTAALGSFVLRGEFLYQDGVRVPLINRNELDIGNLTEGLKPDKVNFFKYVLGAETILFTNLTVSTQFIQFVNLNHQDDSDVYHGNPAVLHLTNGLKKGYKYQNFGSLFLSKPFGVQQDGRVNNIIIAERGGGYWNRLDVEYRFTDQFIGSAEWNMYFGDRDTMFGQFRDSSNFQVGIKYIFD